MVLGLFRRLRRADLAHLVENEAEIPRLKTIGHAWQYMKAKLDITFQSDGVPGREGKGSLRSQPCKGLNP
jgi:hypothetical protein